ncbi:MAG: hypothetical protein MI810_24685 [Flavobacteriales bacterium]|jgi:hypothetical protein|nr:hypothetical protein [Flavobacteriales bacterium]
MRHLKKLLLIALFSGSVSIYAQDWDEGITFSSATISESYCVELDPTQPVAEWYSMDISEFGFTDETIARNQFLQRSNNLVSFNINFEEQIAYARIHLDRTPEPKDIVWWNEYLASLCAAE